MTNVSSHVAEQTSWFNRGIVSFLTAAMTVLAAALTFTAFANV